MRREVKTCAPSDPLSAALSMMDAMRCGCVVVVEQGRPVGMLTDRDACLCLGRKAKAPADVLVREAMSQPVVAVGVGATVDAALDAMTLHRVHRVPVVDDRGALAGLISLHDIAKEALDELALVERGETRTRAVRCRDVGRALGETAGQNGR
ncbi:MAG: CBS domain-containing protein [Acidobacteriota bacterium]